MPPTPARRHQARQSLGIGGAEFEPTSLERYHRTLASAGPAAAWFGDYSRLLDTFTADAEGGRLGGGWRGLVGAAQSWGSQGSLSRTPPPAARPSKPTRLRDCHGAAADRDAHAAGCAAASRQRAAACSSTSLSRPLPCPSPPQPNLDSFKTSSPPPPGCLPHRKEFTQDPQTRELSTLPAPPPPGEHARLFDDEMNA
jgi:hypothetical protein